MKSLYNDKISPLHMILSSTPLNSFELSLPASFPEPAINEGYALKKLNVFIVFCAFSMLIMANGLFGGVSQVYIGNHFSFIENQLAKQIRRPNRWGYSIKNGPSTNGNGLVFFISMAIIIKDLSFTSPDEAQQLFLDIYKDYIQKLNSIREIRPFLAEFPLTPASCPFCLQFFEDPAKILHPPHLIALRTLCRKLQFIESAKVGEGVVLERVMKDTPEFKPLYEPKCPRSPYSQKKTIPDYDISYFKYDMPIYRSEIKCLRNMCARSNFTISSMGAMGKSYQDSRPFEFALRGSQQMDLTQARALIAQCNASLLDYINHDFEFKEFLKEWCGYYKEKYQVLTPIPEHIAYRISFWDENIDRPVAPFIAEIRLLDGKMSYYTADENQRLMLVHEETFQKSLGTNKTDNEKSVQ